MTFLGIQLDAEGPRSIKSQLQQWVEGNRVEATNEDLANLYATSVMAYAAGVFWADNVSQVKWVVKDENGDIIPDTNTDDPVARVVYGPQFRKVVGKKVLTELFWGRDLTHIEHNVFGTTTGLRWISPRMYTLDRGVTEGLKGFRITSRGTNYEPVEVAYVQPQDAIYTNTHSFDDDFDGVSSAEVAFLQTGADVELAQTVYSTFKNMAIPAAIAQPAENKGNNNATGAGNTNVVQALVEWLRGTAKGARNVGKTFVSNSRWEWITLQAPYKDMALDQIPPYLKEATATAFLVSVEFFTTGQTTYAELEGKIQLWQKMRLKPRCILYGEEFTEQWAKRYNRTIEPDLSDLIPEDEVARLDVIDRKLGSQIITIYQAQKEAGVEQPDLAFRDMYMIEGVPVPRSEVRNYWRHKMLVAPSVYNPSEVTGYPLPQPVDPDQVVVDEEGEAKPVGDGALEIEPLPTQELLPSTTPDPVEEPQEFKRVMDTAATDEWAKWRKAAARNLRKGRNFECYFIDDDLEMAAKFSLNKLPDDATREAIRSIFDLLADNPDKVQAILEEIREELEAGADVPDYSDSVMVCFALSDDDQQSLIKATQRAAGINPRQIVSDRLHITLAYLGKVDEMAHDIDHHASRLREWAKYQQSITGKVSGIGRFVDNDSDDDLDPIYASFDSPDIGLFRQSLVEQLTDDGAPPKTSHGFTPHITLAYIPEDYPTPVIRPPDEVSELTFNQIAIVWGEAWEYIDLQGLPLEEDEDTDKSRPETEPDTCDCAAPSAIKATSDEVPADYIDYWRNYDELIEDIGQAWITEYMQRALSSLDSKLGKTLTPQDVFAALEANHDDLVEAWVGTEDNPGPMLRVVLAGTAAGQTALERSNADLDPRAQKNSLVEIDWDQLNQEALDFVRQYAFDLVKGLDETTTDKVIAIFAEWIESGAPISELKEQLEQVFDDPVRASVIGQTESTRAYFEGNKLRWEKAGVTKLRYASVRDSRVTDICRQLHGKIGTMEQGFYSKILRKYVTPPSHVGCRSYTKPYLGDQEPNAIPGGY